MNLLLRSDNRSLNLPVSIDPAWSGNKLQSEKLLINLIICKRGEKEREKPSNSTTNNITVGEETLCVLKLFVLHYS